MSSFKQLNKADVTTVSYTANKQWEFAYDFTDSVDTTNFNNNNYFKIYSGLYTTGTFSPTEPSSNNQYKRLIYDSINHMFYQEYNERLLDTGSIMFNQETYLSASQQRPTGSYFDYNINPLLIKDFPTGSGAEIKVIAINKDTYGSKILPHSFYFSGDNFSVKIVDDGNGNLFDLAGTDDGYVINDWDVLSYFYDPSPGVGIIHIGNIFYAHGLVIITNPSYQLLFEDSVVSYVLTEIDEFLQTEISENIALDE